MLLIGHRGCKYPGYNQNTIRSFEKVTSEGIPAIEFDVQLCADGHLVVVHNLDLEEVSTGKGEVSSTDSATLRTLYAGDPAQSKDQIPFLTDVLDFFTSCDTATRPEIHLELKGKNTGKKTGELFMEYVTATKLKMTDLLVSSFNWQELEALRKVCPEAKIALLDGAIRREALLKKTGSEAAKYFAAIFAYGNEDYMLPRFATLDENVALLDKTCDDAHIHALLAKEITSCLNGEYYTEELLNTANAMNATSVNLWHRTITPEFIQKAHERGLAVLVYTVNAPEELQDMAKMGVDGIFTDYYKDAALLFAN